jgi:hypothetical protein
VKGSATFCEQEVAKSFFKLGRAGFDANGPMSKKSLCRFFQKAANFP